MLTRLILSSKNIIEVFASALEPRRREQPKIATAFGNKGGCSFVIAKKCFGYLRTSSDFILRLQNVLDKMDSRK
jgi:hypothetical protein